MCVAKMRCHNAQATRQVRCHNAMCAGPRAVLRSSSDKKGPKCAKSAIDFIGFFQGAQKVRRVYASLNCLISMTYAILAKCAEKHDQRYYFERSFHVFLHDAQLRTNRN